MIEVEKFTKLTQAAAVAMNTTVEVGEQLKKVVEQFNNHRHPTGYGPPTSPAVLARIRLELDSVPINKPPASDNMDYAEWVKHYKLCAKEWPKSEAQLEHRRSLVRIKRYLDGWFT